MKSFLKQPPELRNGYKDKKRLAALHELPCGVCESGEQTTRTEAHHLIGCGIGKKASDLLTIPLCRNHHSAGISGVSIHATPLHAWESKFDTQENLLERVNLLLTNK